MINDFEPCIEKYKTLKILYECQPKLELSKYFFIFNKNKSIILNSLHDFYYFKFILQHIHINNLIKKQKNTILFLINHIHDKNQFIDAIYYFIGHCKFTFFFDNILEKLKSYTFINDNFVNKKIDYIFIPNLMYKYSNNYLYEYQFNQMLTKIITLILLYQNVDGSATLILPEITNNVSIELIYLLYIFYKKISFSTKTVKIITGGSCNQRIITCKFFKGISLKDILKLNKILKRWMSIDSSNGFCLNYKLNNNNTHSNFIKKIFKWKNKIPDKFYTQINQINKYFMFHKKKQIMNQNKLSSINKKKLIQKQIKFAIKFCKKNKIKIEPYYILYWGISNKSEQITSITNSKIKFLYPNKKNIIYTNLQISNIGEYSITPSSDSFKMAQLLLNALNSYYNINNLDYSNTYVITDGTCGNAGNTIHFSFIFSKVNAIEISELHYNICKNNLNVYNISNVNLIHSNYLNIMKKLKQDIIFLDPPWGGPSYKKFEKLPLYLGTKRLDKIIFNIIQLKICKIIGIKIPYNFDINSFYEYIHYKLINIIPFNKCKLIIIKCI